MFNGQRDRRQVIISICHGNRVYTCKDQISVDGRCQSCRRCIGKRRSVQLVDRGLVCPINGKCQSCRGCGSATIGEFVIKRFRRRRTCTVQCLDSCVLCRRNAKCVGVGAICTNDQAPVGTIYGQAVGGGLPDSMPRQGWP